MPTNLADAIAALVNVTVENSRLLHEMAQSNQNQMHGNHGRNHNRHEATYVDFTDTKPPVFTKADEPLEADDWLRTMEYCILGWRGPILVLEDPRVGWYM